MANAPKAAAPRRGKPAAPPNETTEAKLVRLASARIPKAIRAIQLVSNLRTYKPTEAQVDTIIKALVEQVAETRDALRNVKAAKPKFIL